ncbi:MAG: rhomboid family intramembrane serine protease [Flavobacteriales bacterium]|nr:rhomboid family intramembrane serine protease [Flavobacteriales bacterium]
MKFFKYYPIFSFCLLTCWILFFVLVFVDKSFFSFSTKWIIQMGGADNISIYKGEYWRLFTYVYIHDGFFHLLLNMGVFLAIGTLAEELFKKFELILIILISSFTSGIATFYFRCDEYHVSVGFSSVIMALLSATFVNLYFKNDIERQRMVGSIIIWLFLGNLLLLLSNNSTSVEGHIIGLITGVILIFPYYYAELKIANKLIVNGFLIILVYGTIYASVLIIKNTPDDIYRYDKMINSVINAHDSLYNNWCYFDSLSTIQEQKVYAQKQVDEFSKLISKINLIDSLRISQKLHKKAVNYRSILWLDRTYLTQFFLLKENEKFITKEDIMKYQSARDSLYEVYYE